MLNDLKELISQHGNEHPWVIFAAIVVLPGLGFPSSVLFLMAGAIWGADFRSGTIALLGVVCNIAWTHLAAAGPGKGLLTRWMGRHLDRWRDLPRSDLLKLACMLRLTPGVPLFVQNYALGILGVPLWQSIAVAIPITGLYVYGFVITGGAIFQGHFGMAVAGVSLIVVASIGLRILSKRPSNPPKTKDSVADS
jgi:uncharacterized membrane protein YdjX (TVP38/TMEM64 family)